MARRILLKENGLTGSTPVGYKSIGLRNDELSILNNSGYNNILKSESVMLLVSPIGYGGAVSKRSYISVGTTYEIPFYGSVATYSITNGISKYQVGQTLRSFSTNNYDFNGVSVTVAGVDEFGGITDITLSGSSEIGTIYRVGFDSTLLSKPTVDKELIFADDPNLYPLIELGSTLCLSYLHTSSPRRPFYGEFTIATFSVQLDEFDVITSITITTEESTQGLIDFTDNYYAMASGPGYLVNIGDATIEITDVDTSGYIGATVSEVAIPISGTANEPGFVFKCKSNSNITPVPLLEKKNTGYPAYTTTDLSVLLKIRQMEIQYASNLTNYNRYNGADFTYLNVTEDTSRGILTYKVTIPTNKKINSVELQAWGQETGSIGRYSANMNNCSYGKFTSSEGTTIREYNSISYSFYVDSTGEDLGGGIKNCLAWRGWIENVTDNSFDLYLECPNNSYKLTTLPFSIQMIIS